MTSSDIQSDVAGGHVDASWFDEPLTECDKVDGVQNARWPHQDEGVCIHLTEKAVMFELKREFFQRAGGHIGKCGRQGLQSGAVSFGQAQKEKAEPQGERA